MTTESNQSHEEAPQATDQPDTGKGLRAQLEAALAENRTFKADKRDSVLAGIGLDPNVGLGKALVEKFDDGKIPLDSLAQTAITEYGHVPPEQTETHPQAQQIQTGQAQLDQVNDHAGSIVPPTQATELQEAEASGDYQRTLDIKARQMDGWFQGPPR